MELDKLRLATRKEEEDAIGKGGADPFYIGAQHTALMEMVTLKPML